MALMLASCRPHPNWIPRNPKLMFQICQKLRRGLFIDCPPVGFTHGYYIRPLQGRTWALNRPRGFHPRLFDSTPSGSDPGVESPPWVSPTAITYDPFRVGPGR